MQTTEADIRFAREAGAGGVIGALDGEGCVDTAAVARFVAAADGIDVTFHRAIVRGRRPAGDRGRSRCARGDPHPHLGWRFG
ncbi:conserved hypothetical protein [Leifsonia xyli subsp. xyli str. CTCB07]|uniref:Uncharacterized protein n=1 Tax=Leifsonia xyli subsp. xyli (strain CTCB07) TaxID=281090 RepID=Q6AEP3_LEIXX|nr:conserved hypothetical protein [Leifsonia xyli subsp. xyli str. CTCB07]